MQTLSTQLQERDFVVSHVHSHMDKTQRDLMMREFKTGSNRVLITTDLLPHGFDVQQVPLVINYDIPANFENYLHRIGKSGRFGPRGVVINLVTENDVQLLKDLKSHYNTQIVEMPSDLSEVL